MDYLQHLFLIADLMRKGELCKRCAGPMPCECAESKAVPVQSEGDFFFNNGYHTWERGLW
jgi:hypothetical protein